MTKQSEIDALKRKVNTLKREENREHEKKELEGELFRMKHKTLFKVGDSLRAGLGRVGTGLKNASANADNRAGNKKTKNGGILNMNNRRRLVEEL